jgi:serine/threonine protein kinase
VLNHKLICALHYLQTELKVIHRDVKPSNILANSRRKETARRYVSIVIQAIEGETMFLVPVAHKHPTTTPDLLWRYSTSLAERRLCSNLDKVQRKSFILFKLFVQYRRKNRGCGQQVSCSKV